ncbi:hypothetical protein E3N88_31987 [Mikania micrantha]|uniref:ubiquitinyl hydrolase 1 n=1 Tax=Mikania micrantha TaxID=192012 RepID=A0A5N6M9V4_9ASTR|nr:hypothetical protein E3N88_31987 [Mikania micrantha]
MAEDGKVAIEKFNGSDFDKPDKMEQADWELKDKKARAVITLALAKSVAFNIMKETTASGMMKALSNMYEKPSAANKVFLIRELVNTKMMEGASLTSHINNLNSILSRLLSVGIKFDDEVQALLLLSLFPDSWSGTITAVTSSARASGMTFVGIRDLVLGEDIRRKNQGGSSSSEMLHVGRGRRNSRDSGSWGRSSSRTKKIVKCWNCNEVGHVKSQCPKKQLNAATKDVFEDDALILSENSVDSWVMDYGALFHATHSSELMKNLKIGDFGKVRLGNGEFLNVTGIGDGLAIDEINNTESGVFKKSEIQKNPKLWEERLAARIEEKDAFTRNDLDVIAEKLVLEDPYKGTWTPFSVIFKPHHNSLTGNYDVNVLVVAVEGKGKKVIWHDRRNKASSIDLDESEGKLTGIVLNVPVKRYGGIWRSRHWVSLRKINGVWYNLDSDFASPYAFKSIDELRDFLDFAIDGGSEILLVKDQG